MTVFDDQNGRFLVLRNDVGQYSLWPLAVDIPAGWSAVSEAGSRQECLDHIDRVWTDMRQANVSPSD